MHIITDRKRILALQYKLNKRLKELMPDLAKRRVDVPKLNSDVTVNHNLTMKKWFYYQDNIQSHKHTFFVGNWKYGGGSLPYTGSISISWDGNGSNAGIFVEEGADVYLLHSGNMGRKTKKNFFEAYEGNTKEIEISDETKTYAVVGRMDDPDLAVKVANFFDFIQAK